MPSPGASAPPRLTVEDSYLELLADTLESLDLPARGQFLRTYFRTVTHLDLREGQCVQLWDEMLVRRRELTESTGRPVSLKTALVDVLSSAGLFRVPVILEYEELKKLQLNAVTDVLTGLNNRRTFAESFEKELNRARRYSQPLGLVILDLHRFKEVNDRHGHPRGDDVLRTAAATLKRSLRTSDTAFRIGGDEFALLLPQTDAESAIALSKRIEVVFAEMLQPLQLSIEVHIDHGVATFPQDGDQADQLIRVADERLYRLKHANHRRISRGEAAPTAGAAEVPHPEPVRPISTAPGPQPRPPEPTKPSAMAAAASAAAQEISTTESLKSPVYSIQRKAERVSMRGTNAYAVLGEQGGSRARVLDLGFGGVALELDAAEKLPPMLLAILHVPILPPVRVNLKQVWSQTTTEGVYRVGCCFVS